MICVELYRTLPSPLQITVKIAINTANANSDAAAIFKLTADINPGSATLARPTTSITIDTQGFTLRSMRVPDTTGQTLTLAGTIFSTASAPAVGTTTPTSPSSIIALGDALRLAGLPE